MAAGTPAATRSASLGIAERSPGSMRAAEAPVPPRPSRHRFPPTPGPGHRTARRAADTRLHLPPRRQGETAIPGAGSERSSRRVPHVRAVRRLRPRGSPPPADRLPRVDWQPRPWGVRHERRFPARTADTGADPRSGPPASHPCPNPQTAAPPPSAPGSCEAPRARPSSPYPPSQCAWPALRTNPTTMGVLSSFFPRPTGPPRRTASEPSGSARTDRGPLVPATLPSTLVGP